MPLLKYASVRAVILATVLSAAVFAHPAATLKLVGLDGTMKSLGMAALQALPQIELTDSGASGKVRFRGPTVRSLLSLVGAPEGRALCGPNMLLIVIAEASDGYKVAYTPAELVMARAIRQREEDAGRMATQYPEAAVSDVQTQA